MKHNYLYQGWAGNTYSHKCTGNSKIIYYEFTDKIVNKEINLLDALMLFANIKVIQDGLEMYALGAAAMEDNVLCKQAAYLPLTQNNTTYNTFEEAYAELPNSLSNIPITDIIKRRITEEEYWSL